VVSNKKSPIYSFSKVDFDYTLPEWGDVDNYKLMVESLPLVNSPAVFGLHPNAEIGYYSNAVKGMWMDLISLQPRRAGGGDGISREDYIVPLPKTLLAKYHSLVWMLAHMICFKCALCS